MSLSRNLDVFVQDNVEKTLNNILEQKMIKIQMIL